MEKGDSSKNCGGGIPLDWDKLFRDSDKEEAAPPQLVVESTMKRQKLQDEESSDGLFPEFSDSQLIQSMERKKRTLLEASKRLSDGGEKLRLLIKRHEVEIQRRKENLQKSHDLKCLGAHDGNQKETPCQVNNVSEFAASLLKKMENPTETTFRNELSMLNRCGGQKLISSGHDLSARRYKGSLPLRQTQSISPENLSLHGDKCLLPKDDPKGRFPMIASPSSSKYGVATKCSDKNSFEAQASNGRRKYNTFALVDLEEPEVAEVVPDVDQVDECMKDSRIYYPSRDDAASVEICYSDLDCLGPEAYLTSTIINFYIRYLQQNRSSLSDQADNYHFFNTYFYEKLKISLEKENDNGSSFSKIRRWWKGVKLFEKSYIFLPIHEQSHWSLIIICIPDKEEGMGPIILHLDSLGIHYSQSIFGNIKRLLIGEWNFMVKEDPDPCLPFLRSIQDNLHRSIVEKKTEVPQQRNEYDCGVFVLFFLDRFIEMAPKRMKDQNLAMFGRRWFKPSEASRLRVTIRKLLKDEFKKAKEHNCLLHD